MPDAKNDVVIEATTLSKQFQLNRFRSGDLRELVAQIFQPKTVAPATEAFYALRDVSFTIRRGEAVGIVGHNGSGKSTLLKMLTGIMKPDTGSLTTRGRIGALIEVGAGFHPDLSGRENIFLNGSILGLSRQEIAEKFDEIVAFAGLERFIDTPVKRYSSGMYMRLGFAIATHIDPDILLIDEVLAVGDTQFQRKCLRHLQEFREGGGTVVFVSHAMGQVAELCDRCLWLDRGQLLHDGATSAAIDKYMQVVAGREEEELKRSHPEEWAAREAERVEQERWEAEAQLEMERQAALDAEQRKAELQARRAQGRQGQILDVRLYDGAGKEANTFRSGDPARVEVRYRFGTRQPNRPNVGVDILRVDPENHPEAEMHLFTISNYDHKMALPSEIGEGGVAIDYEVLALPTGEYRLRVNLFGDTEAPGWPALPDDTHDEGMRFRVEAMVKSPGPTYMPTRIRILPGK